MAKNNGGIMETGKYWAMEPAALERLYRQMGELSAKATGADYERWAVEKNSGAKKSTIYRKEGSTGIIEIRGPLFRSVPYIYKVFGVEAAGYDEIQEAVAEAVADNDVDDIILVIESPGGEVWGTMETAQAIREASIVKPVVAYIENMGASAAYWIASQASKIYANELSEVGSIGVYTVIEDSSKLYENAGIKMNLIRSGKYKGVGVMGVGISEAELAPEQEIIFGMAKAFIETVARGRGMAVERVSELATGRAWLGAEARDNGLVDGIGKISETAVIYLRRKSMEITLDQLKAERPDLVERIGAEAAKKREAEVKAVYEARTAQALKNNYSEAFQAGMLAARKRIQSDCVNHFRGSMKAMVDYCEAIKSGRALDQGSVNIFLLSGKL